MRAFFFATIICFLAGSAIAAESSPQQPPRRIAPQPSSPAANAKSQIDHLKAAADHLAKADRQAEAEKLREQICIMESGQAEALLTKKEKELDELRSQVELLRKLTRREPQISLSLQVIQFSRERLKSVHVPNIDRLFSRNQKGTAPVHVVQNSREILDLLDSLRERELVKVLAEPTIVTISGRPARFHSGGEIATLKPAPEQPLAIAYARFGTEVDVVPVLLGNDKMRLEMRLRVAEIDPTRSVPIGENAIPTLRTLEVDTGAELRLGETLVLGGPTQNRVESQADAYGNTEEVTDQIDTVVLITPRRIDDTQQVGQAPASSSYIEPKTSARPNPTKRAR